MKFILYSISICALLMAAGCCKKHLPLLTLEFRNFDFTNMDSVMLISTDAQNIENHIDTTYHDLTQNHLLGINIWESVEERRNYIVKSTSPQFEHRITDITFKKRRISTCGQKPKWTLRWDGEFRDEKSSSNIIVTP